MIYRSQLAVSKLHGPSVRQCEQRLRVLTPYQAPYFYWAADKRGIAEPHGSELEKGESSDFLTETIACYPPSQMHRLYKKLEPMARHNEHVFSCLVVHPSFCCRELICDSEVCARRACPTKPPDKTQSITRKF